MKNQSLHLVKNICIVQKKINELEQSIYKQQIEIKTLLETNNHLIDELVIRVQIDCNEEDLNNEIKETLLTGGQNG